MAIAAIIRADVVAFATELGLASAKLGDSYWADVLDYVNQINLTTCDTDIDRRMARIYLAAHIGTMNTQGHAGVAGPLASESAGGIRRSYMAPVVLASRFYLSTTPYGQMYLDILGTTAAAYPMVI